jgi:signal transduction histidine kinase
MTDTPDDLAARYTAALRDYLAGAGEAALHRVYQLGREGIGKGLGLLPMAALHHEALATALSGTLAPEERARTVRAAGSFFAESLAPFEMAHRGFQDANAALRRLNEALEEEARQIAHALHDEAGQLLASVHIRLEEVASELPPRARARLRGVRDLLDQIEAQLRRLSHELRPTILDDLGLQPALDYLAQGVSTRAGLAVTVEGSTAGRLPRPVETVLYRIVQEALNNASKHARASRVTVRIERDARTIRCSVRDDGVGFDAPVVLAQRGKGGLGLIGMRERLVPVGGRLEITSAPGRGTTLAVEVPLEE